jgi:hypothetical protein
MSKYYWSTKSSVKHNLGTNISNLESLFCQESERMLSTDLIEVEGPNMISCPPHFIKLIHALKLLREVENSIDNGEFFSLEEKSD